MLLNFAGAFSSNSGVAHRHAKQALKLALLELTTRRWLRTETVAVAGDRGRTTTLTVFTRGESAALAGAGPPETIAPLWAAYESHAPAVHEIAGGSGVQVRGVEAGALVRRILERVGGLLNYSSRVVFRSLERQGWARWEKYKLLWIIPAVRPVLTRSGMEAQADLLWRIQYGNREFGRLVSVDPQRALAFVGLSGAALLLMSDALPHVRALRDLVETEQRRAAALGQTATPAGALTDSSGMTDVGAVDAVHFMPAVDAADALDAESNLDVSALDHVDLSALDGMNSALSAVDASIDAAGDGDGSSDGGDGSDGGDSGGDAGGSSE